MEYAAMYGYINMLMILDFFKVAGLLDVSADLLGEPFRF